MLKYRMRFNSCRPWVAVSSVLDQPTPQTYEGEAQSLSGTSAPVYIDGNDGLSRINLKFESLGFVN